MEPTEDDDAAIHHGSRLHIPFNNPELDDVTEALKNLMKQLLVFNPSERLKAKQALALSFTVRRRNSTRSTSGSVKYPKHLL